MAEKREIELIPRELEAAKGLANFLAKLRFVGFGLLGAGVILSVAAWGGALGQEARLNGVEDSISKQTSALAKLADTEKMVLGLQVKSQGVIKIFTERNYFSSLLDALSASTPSGITVKGLEASKDEILVTLSGTTTSYEELSRFLKNLVDPTVGGSIFIEASLTSVVADSATGRAGFVVEAKTRPQALRKLVGGGK